MLRISDTIQRPPSVALQHGLDFMSWIKLGNEKDIMVQKLSMRGTLDERIESIHQKFYWAPGGGLCCKGTISYQEWDNRIKLHECLVGFKTQPDLVVLTTLSPLSSTAFTDLWELFWPWFNIFSFSFPFSFSLPFLFSVSVLVVAVAGAG